MCFATSIVSNFLVGESLVIPLKNHHELLLASTVWYYLLTDLFYDTAVFVVLLTDLFCDTAVWCYLLTDLFYYTGVCGVTY